MHNDPASRIISLLGGLTHVSKAAGATVTTVQRWRLPVEKGGTGGHIPRKYHDALIALAEKRGIELTAVSFVDASGLPTAEEAAA